MTDLSDYNYIVNNFFFTRTIHITYTSTYYFTTHVFCEYVIGMSCSNKPDEDSYWPVEIAFTARDERGAQVTRDGRARKSGKVVLLTFISIFVINTKKHIIWDARIYTPPSLLIYLVHNSIITETLLSLKSVACTTGHIFLRLASRLQKGKKRNVAFAACKCDNILNMLQLNRLV